MIKPRKIKVYRAKFYCGQLQYCNANANRRIAVSAYLESEKLLLFVFARHKSISDWRPLDLYIVQSVCLYNTAVQNHIAVTAYFPSKQLLSSGFVEHTRSSVIVKIETHSISVAQNYLSERLLKPLWGLSQCITHTLPWFQNTTFDLHSHGGYSFHFFLGVVQDCISAL